MPASELYLMDPIEEAGEMVADIRGLPPGDLDVYVNSPGGDVFAGVAIMSALRMHPGQVTMHVMGLAGSIASAIVLGAGDRVLMYASSRLMLHNPWTLTIGDAGDHRHTAGVLDGIREDMIMQVYGPRLPHLSIEDLQSLLDTETWIGPDEAVRMGLADEVMYNRSDLAKARLPRDEESEPLAYLRAALQTVMETG